MSPSVEEHCISKKGLLGETIIGEEYIEVKEHVTEGLLDVGTK